MKRAGYTVMPNEAVPAVPTGSATIAVEPEFLVPTPLDVPDPPIHATPGRAVGGANLERGGLGPSRCDALRPAAEPATQKSAMEVVFSRGNLPPPADCPDHSRNGTQCSAVGDDVDSERHGHLVDGALRPAADLSLLHALLGHYARQLYDVQKTRIAMSLRVQAMERDGLPDVWRLPAEQATESLHAVEKALNRQIERLARQHPLRRWIESAPGIGLAGFARLMGITGSLDRFANVAKLWAYLGLAVVDGHAPKKVKGEKLNYSPQGRVLCHQIAESIVKVNRGPYRGSYDRKKAEYEQGRPDWTQAHRHNAAMRYAVKELLKDLWLEWRRVVPREAA